MPQSSTIDAEKRALRKAMIEQRARLGSGARLRGAAALAERGLDFVEIAKGAVVSGFAAMADELDPLPLMMKLSGDSHPLALPVTTRIGKPLKFRQWSPGTPLVEASFGLREPPATAPEVDPDILLVPLLAFDAAGYRLGFGAAYYDRTLARLRALKRVTAIGIAFDQQKVEKVPHDDYDERLDWVLTPSGPLRIEG